MDPARLRGIPLFSGLSERQRKKLAEHLREVEIARGEHLVDEGEFPYEFFVIQEGRAAVVSGSMHLADLGPHDFVGEIALMERGRRTASVIATSPVKALVMSRKDFRRMTRSLPSVGRQIDAAIAERLERNRLFGLGPD